jgi:hypothetical protein
MDVFLKRGWNNRGRPTHFGTQSYLARISVLAKRPLLCSGLRLAKQYTVGILNI